MPYSPDTVHSFNLDDCEDMSSLKARITHLLSAYGLTPEDILWVGSSDGTKACDWETFCKLSARIKHRDVSFNELYIVGDGWWLEWEYDSYNTGYSKGFLLYKAPTLKLNSEPLADISELIF